MIYLAEGLDADGTTSAVAWTKTQNGSQFSIVAAYGTWGGGTVVIQHEVTTDNWIQIASLTSGATTSWLMKILPNGNYRAVLSGATSPDLTIVLKPV